ncbi:hypothetical protein WN943_019528 [Citrus x changshan-huyou]
MAVKCYQSQVELFLKEYILADPFVPYTSIVDSIFVCKMVYYLAKLISAVQFKCYSSFSNIQWVEWKVVDKFLDCDWSDSSLLEKGTPEEQKLKRARFMELKEDLKKAFYKDMAEKNPSGLSSSSPKEGVKCKGRQR